MSPTRPHGHRVHHPRDQLNARHVNHRARAAAAGVPGPAARAAADHQYPSSDCRRKHDAVFPRRCSEPKVLPRRPRHQRSRRHRAPVRDRGRRRGEASTCRAVAGARRRPGVRGAGSTGRRARRRPGPRPAGGARRRVPRRRVGAGGAGLAGGGGALEEVLAGGAAFRVCSAGC